MDLQTILISLITSVFTVLGGKFWDTYLSKKASDEELHYLAIRLIYLFDGYASECVKRVTNHEHFEFSGALIGEPILTLPMFLELPESSVYKRLEHHILWQTYNFPQRIKDHEAHINSCRFLEEDEVKEFLIKYTIELGIHASDYLIRTPQSNYLRLFSPK